MDAIEVEYEVFQNIRALNEQYQFALEGQEKRNEIADTFIPVVLLSIINVIAVVLLYFYSVNELELFYLLGVALIFLADVVLVPQFKGSISTIFSNGITEKRTVSEQAFVDDPIVQFAHRVVEAEKEISAFIQSWNDYVCRRDLGILDPDPELEKMGPVAQKAHDTMANILLMAREFVKMRAERLLQDECVTELQMASGIDIAEVLENLTKAANDAQAYIKAYQEIEGVTASPLDAIAKIDRIQAELRRDIPESKKALYAAKASQHVPA